MKREGGGVELLNLTCVTFSSLNLINTVIQPPHPDISGSRPSII